MLEMFGVHARTERVYRAMLESPEADVDALAHSLGMSSADVTAELDRLAELMLVTPGREGHAVQLPVAPDQAIESLLARQEQRLAELQSHVEDSRRHVTSYVEAFVEHRVRRDDLGLVEIVEDSEVVRSRLYQLVRAAEHSACTIHSGAPLPQASLEPSSRLDRELLARKVAVRVIVATSSLAPDHWRAHLQGLAEAGGQIRIHPSPGSHAIVIDDSVAVIARAGSPGALILNGPDLVAPVAHLFAQLWTNAQIFEPDSSTDGGEAFSEARLRQVVALLALGMKDEAIARKTATSVRTVRRLVAAATAALQAESRFQAGVEAVRRGWVD